jgi:hypothetical protein
VASTLTAVGTRGGGACSTCHVARNSWTNFDVAEVFLPGETAV